MPRKKRLGDLLIERGWAKDARAAFIAVTEGTIFVDGRKAISPAQPVDPGGAVVAIRGGAEYVGRGAHKLASALDAFDIDPNGAVCADIGAATGGFTEVLLRRGAKKVYAIDTARGKLAEKVRRDPRLVPMEKTDARRIESLPERADIVVIDVSLVSLRAILKAAGRFLKPEGAVVALFKPQYETRDPAVLRHGIIRDAEAREALRSDFSVWATGHDWKIKGMIESPIRGDKGNTEYLFYLRRP